MNKIFFIVLYDICYDFQAQTGNKLHNVSIFRFLGAKLGKKGHIMMSLIS